MHRFLPLFLLMYFIGFSQDENPSYAGRALDFLQAYNNSNYKSIFDMFDVNMKRALPYEETIDFFSQTVKRPMGEIEDMQFLEIKNGGHIYRTRFNKAVTDIFFNLNAANQISGLYIYPPKPFDVPRIERNSTLMQLPFNNEWFVFWGGTTEEDNYHVAYENQKFAFDLVRVVNGKTFSGDAERNENYFAFGQEIVAPCKAQVVEIIDGVKDNVPGVVNSFDLTGNTVVLRTDDDEFLVLAHLKENSIVVEEGQEVNAGEVLAQCGNSGNSSEPHLHLSLQNTQDMANAIGGKLYFDSILVNGETHRDYLPKKGEYISNSN
ncbi:M23 family metallopeptidase [Croceivirga thetidis]|uniref:Peptidoglycan DD-metalloendopeptidase family protein n=1 Tax=Croceivirga thetidis TaxID=2721623 RepID=A0ABX1GM25_9FLAO|nr:M23 family metallopeptidase [Croceivirga thetidis]NKI30693.1 peptidoglycan DD-metalloendopeptidase family protein [Croceivirga thetidis]